MGNLATNPHFEWGPTDYKVSEVMQGYFANFVKTGNPNGPGLPTWPAYESKDGFRVMRIEAEPRAEAREDAAALPVPGSALRDESVDGYGCL